MQVQESNEARIENSFSGIDKIAELENSISTRFEQTENGCWINKITRKELDMYERGKLHQTQFIISLLKNS